MDKKSLSWGIGLTVIWCIAVGFLIFLGEYSLPTELNTLGDFLAGACAPIAFFWLILGYIQQGKQLEQNTKALEQQEYALRLQIDEMKESVKQQRELAKIQSAQFDAMQKSVEPWLIFSFFRTEIYDKEIYAYDEDGECLGIDDVQPTLRILLKVENKGKEAKKIKFFDSNKSTTLLYLHKICENESKELSFELDTNRFRNLEKKGGIEIDGQLILEDMYGFLKINNFKIDIFKVYGGAYFDINFRIL